MEADRRADMRAAMLATILGNAYRDAEKHPQEFTIDDFMPKIQTADRDTGQAPEDLMTLTRLMHQMCGGDEI